MKANKWEKLNMGELENLVTEIAGGAPVSYQIGRHKLETTFSKKVGRVRTVNNTTGEILESAHKSEWFYSDLLLTLVEQLLMTADD